MLQVEKGIHPIALEEQKGGLTWQKSEATSCQKNNNVSNVGVMQKKKKSPDTKWQWPLRSSVSRV